MEITNLIKIVMSHNIDLIKLLFIQFTFTMVVFGLLVGLIEKYLPDSIKQSFRYGKHAHKGKSDKLVEKIEIPKAWFKHFYVFALIWSWLFMYLAVDIYFLGGTPSTFLKNYLNFSCGNDRKVETSPLISLTALTLMTLQCTRRFIETNFLQIFSKKSKINLSHYVVGYLHYYGVIVLIAAKSAGFVNDDNDYEFYTNKELFLVIVASTLFLFVWYKQWESNMIFINLRKGSSGQVVTEKHLLPKGGWFNLVSSPHMLSEILMYIILFILLHSNTTYIHCLIWVISNQIFNAWLTHKWYLENFPRYPKERKAIIPFLL